MNNNNGDNAIQLPTTPLPSIDDIKQKKRVFTADSVEVININFPQRGTFYAQEGKLKELELHGVYTLARYEEIRAKNQTYTMYNEDGKSMTVDGTMVEGLRNVGLMTEDEYILHIEGKSNSNVVTSNKPAPKGRPASS